MKRGDKGLSLAKLTEAGRAAALLADRHNRSAAEAVPLARVWSAGEPCTCAYLALPGTAYETAALAHRIAAWILTDANRATRFDSWPVVDRDRHVTIVRVRCAPEFRDDAVLALVDGLHRVGRDGRQTPTHRIEVRS